MSIRVRAHTANGNPGRTISELEKDSRNVTIFQAAAIRTLRGGRRTRSAHFAYDVEAASLLTTTLRDGRAGRKPSDRPSEFLANMSHELRSRGPFRLVQAR